MPKRYVKDYSDEELRELIQELGPAGNQDTDLIVTLVQEWADHSIEVHHDVDVVDERCSTCVEYATKTCFAYGLTVEQLALAYNSGGMPKISDRLEKLLGAVLERKMSVWDA